MRLPIRPDDWPFLWIKLLAGGVGENGIEIMPNPARPLDLNRQNIRKLPLLLRPHFRFDALPIEKTKRRPAIRSRVRQGNFPRSKQLILQRKRPNLIRIPATLRIAPDQ